jgi:hypothetical protein
MSNYIDQLNGSVSEWNQWRRKNPKILPDLSNADLRGKKLSSINFRRVNLEGANLCGVALDSADLSYANLAMADLTGANLCHANLHGTIFRKTTLREVRCRKATMHETQLLNVDMRTAKGLDTIQHMGPSMIDVATIGRSTGSIPQKFLQGVGLTGHLLEAILEQSKNPLSYFTCFISYASEDQRFAEILYHDLQQRGVRCWFAPMNLRPGDKFPEKITNAIQHHDKLLLILSKHALASDWVKKEVEIARNKERGGKVDVLLPICLDTALPDSPGWASFILKKHHLADFVRWKHRPVYQEQLGILLQVLQGKPV